MGYDGLDRLTNTSSPMFGAAGYAYDTADNLVQATVSGGSQPRTHYYCYSASTNRLDFVRTGPSCSTSPAAIALAYDVQGNLSVKNGASYAFDVGNRLRSAAGLNYRYDGLGRRVRQDSGGGQRRYSMYAQDGRVVWQRDEVAGRRINNVYFAGSLLAELSRPLGAETATVSYVHTDALGSPIAKTNSAGAVIETSEYEPYGLLLNRTNDDRVGYTGHVMDAASGLIYMQQRYYDPQIGRFLSVDPVTADSVTGSNFNRYWYANNSPYKFTDPDGREVKFSAGHPADFNRNAAVAIRFLNSNGLANAIGSVHLDKQVVHLAPSSNRTDATTNHFDPSTNTLYWADKAGYIMKDAVTGEEGRRSPALILGHEFEHVANRFASPKDQSKDRRTPDAQFGNREEANVITEYENPAAEKLGEPHRDSHDPKKGERSEPTNCVKTSCQ